MRVRARVYDSNGRPVDGARVRMRIVPGDFLYHVLEPETPGVYGVTLPQDRAPLAYDFDTRRYGMSVNLPAYAKVAAQLAFNHMETEGWADNNYDGPPITPGLKLEEDLASEDNWGYRAALRWTLAQRLGIHPAAVAIRRGERGRPMLDEGRAPDFNVTHTLGVALIAHLDRPGWRVGVDIEGVDRTLSHDALARKFLTAGERSAIAALDEMRRRLPPNAA